MTMRIYRVYRRRAVFVKPLGALALFASIAVGEVQSACRQVCTTQTSCDSLSGEERWRCVAGRSGETNTCRTVCTDSHGAIDYSRKTGSWGHSHNHENQARANRAALGYCGRVAADCLAVSFTNQCGAIAETKVGDELRPGPYSDLSSAIDRFFP